MLPINSKQMIHHHIYNCKIERTLINDPTSNLKLPVILLAIKQRFSDLSILSLLTDNPKNRVSMHIHMHSKKIR